MINNSQVKKYCKDDIKLIENYDKAIADKFKTWDCHHRDEITLHKSVNELINDGLYWNVPASHLIFLEKSNHMKLHSEGNFNCNYNKKISEATKEKCRATWKKKYENGYINPRTGKSPFENFTKEQLELYKVNHSNKMKQLFESNPEISEKISKKLKGQKRTEEQRNHYKESFTEERKRQISENTRKINFEHSAEISKRTTENNKKHKGKNSYVYGRKWMNNGIEEKILSKDNFNSYLNKGYKFGRLCNI